MRSKTGFGPQVTTSRVSPAPPPAETGDTELTPEERPDEKEAPSELPEPDPAPSAQPAGSIEVDAVVEPARQGRIESLQVGDIRSMSNKLTVALDPLQQASLDRWSQRARFGAGAQMTMKCAGQDCPFIEQCPLWNPRPDMQGNKPAPIPLPVGLPCPVEEHLQDLWLQDFMVTFQIREDDPDIGMLRMLVGGLLTLLMQENRLAWTAASNPKVLSEDCIGFTKDGDPLMIQKLSPVLDQMTKLAPAKVRILRELLATPRSKVEAKQKGWNDPSIRAAEAQVRAKKLRDLREIQKGNPTFNVSLGQGDVPKDLKVRHHEKEPD